MFMHTEAIQQLRVSCVCEGIQAFDYSFRRQSNCEDLHEDEEVILNLELTTHSLVSDMENC